VAVRLWYGQAKLQTTNTIAFYQWQFECTKILWRDPEAHCHAIHPPPSPHVSCRKDLYTIPGSWKCPSSSMARILTRCVTHWAYMFGMLWIDVYDSVFQFPPIPSDFAQPLKRSGSTGHNQQPDQLCEGDVSRCMRHMVVTPDTGGFWSTQLTFFFKVSDAYLYSQSCEIHTLSPHLFI
jgi:hypothetical protein